jgi:hypothetical protein
MILLWPLMIVAVALAVEDKTKTPPATPQITDAHRAEFFKRQLALANAQQAFQAAQSQAQQSIAEMSKDCGDKFRPQLDQQGDPVCVVIPEPPKPAVPAKK